MEMNGEDPSRRRSENQPSFSMNEFPSLGPTVKPQAETKKQKKKKGKGQQKDQPITNNTTNNIKVPEQPKPAQGGQELNLASRLKLHQLQEKFNHVPKEIVAQTFVSTNYNVDQTVQTLVEFYGAPESISGEQSEQLNTEEEEDQQSSSTPKKTVFTSVPKLWV